MVIDANMYWMPEALFEDEAVQERFLALAAEREGYCAYRTPSADSSATQIVVEKPKGRPNLNYVSTQYALERQMAAMDRAGVDHAVLKLPGCQQWLDLELCRLFNTEMAIHTQASGGRLSALMVLPPIADGAVIAELGRCADELGLVGVQLSSHYQGNYLDDERFRPLLREINRRKLPIYVHHASLPPQYDALLEYDNLRRSYGRAIDQVTAVSRELFSGMFEELCDLRMVHSMLGGGFFAYANIMFPNRPRSKEAVSRFTVDTDDIKRYLKHNILFEMSHAEPWGKVQLESAIAILGADQVIFGSSYPVREDWLENGPAFVGSLNIEEEAKRLVLGGNAKRVYGI